MALAGAALSGCGSSKPLPERIDAIVADALDHGFSGTVLVARSGETLYEKHAGLADRTAKLPVAADTRFRIASLSKPFTAVLILQLVEQGRLKTSDRLDAIFAGTRGTPAGAVTIDQLLSHTSGIEELTERHLDRPLTPDDLPAAKLIHFPGTFHYSSAGYVVLKLVIETVSGQPYAQCVTDRILKPAGMTQSGILRTGAPPAKLAIGYSPDGAIAKLPVAIELLDGAGSLYSTASDLARFDRALAGNRLLSAATQKLMNARHTPDGESEWAYGWALAEQGGQWYPWAKGDLPGYTAALARQTHRDEVVVIPSNNQASDVSEMRRDILYALKKD